MVPLLQQARSLRDDCVRHGHEAIERPDCRPEFLSLFRDVHAFAKGIANPDKVTTLARSLARVVGCLAPEDELERQGRENDGVVDRGLLLQEEAVWQGAAGAFVGRFRTEYTESYSDVVTGICDAVQVTRMGLRILAAACAFASSWTQSTDEGQPLVTIQGMLLSFPYTCCEGLTAVRDESGEGLVGSLQAALGPEGLHGIDEHNSKTGRASGAQHMMLLQVNYLTFYLVESCNVAQVFQTAVAAAPSMFVSCSLYLKAHLRGSFQYLVQ